MSAAVQGTDEWRMSRLGRVTASRIADVMAQGKRGAPSATRATYMGQLAAERLSGVPTDTFTNAAMQHGTETEPKARALYALMHGQAVEECGSVPHPEIALSSASPDGLVGTLGLVEIKCPNQATHIATLQGASIKRPYRLQMEWQMACTGRQWCDFVSFDPRFPPELQMHVTRVTRDQSLTDEIEAAVIAFLSDLDWMVADLRGRCQSLSVAA